MEPADEESARPAIGSILEDRYRLVGELGEGGIGWVYRAEHLKLGHEVAIKMLQPQYAGHALMRPRFEREAKALASLAHPHIVTVTDFSVSEGRPYLVMELLEGRTLGELLEEGPMEEELARHIATQILDAMVHAHDAGLVHRDLKPANVFSCALPTDPHHIKILDFGFVKLIADDGDPKQSTLTQSGVAFGTPSYMSPEQATGGETDARTDIYALGVILFEMLAGRRPFVGTLQEIVRQHLIEPVPRLSVGGRPIDASPGLGRVLAKAMAKEKADRYASARELRDALAALPVPWLVPKARGEDETMLAPAEPSGSEPTAAARPGARSPNAGPLSESSHKESAHKESASSASARGAGSPSTASSNAASPVGPRESMEAARFDGPPADVAPPPRPARRRSLAGLTFGLTLVGVLVGASVWWFEIRPAAVAELGVASVRGAFSAPTEAEAGAASPEPEAIPEEGGEAMASLLDELSGDDWWSYASGIEAGGADDPAAPGALAEASADDDAGGEANDDALDDDALADDETDDALADDETDDALADDDELADGPIEPVAEAVDAERSDEVDGEAYGRPSVDGVETSAASAEIADERETGDAPSEDAEDGASTEEDDPLGPNPWRARPVVQTLVSARRRVLAGQALDSDAKARLRALVAADRGDPRPHLAIAQSFMAEGNDRGALERYDLAHRVDDTARGDPRMLFDLLRLATEGDVRSDAYAALDRIYGEDALGFIDELLDEGELPEPRAEALSELRDRLEEGDSAEPARSQARRSRPRARRSRPRAHRSRRARAQRSRARARRSRAARARRSRAARARRNGRARRHGRRGRRHRRR